MGRGVPAFTASLSISVARAGRHVLLLTFGPDIGPIVDAAAVSASREDREDVCMLDPARDPWTYMEVRSSLTDLAVTIAASVPDAGAARTVIAGLATRPDVVVVSDADARGTVSGEDVLPDWRAAAAALGVPIVLVISGAGYGWSEPEDAHVEVTRTHVGPHSACFIARGVLPFGPASETVGVKLWRRNGAVLVATDVLHGERGRIPPRRLERSWDEQPAIPVRLDVLARIVRDPSWNPANTQEASDVLRSLATYALDSVFERSPDLRTLEPAPLERVVLVCGGLDAWARTLAEVGRDHDRRAWERVESSALPRPELPDDAPREWVLAREIDRVPYQRARYRTPIGGGLYTGPAVRPVGK
jgi:hypothetical protein